MWMMTVTCVWGEASASRERGGSAVAQPTPADYGRITVLTSMDAESLKAVGVPRSPRAQVLCGWRDWHMNAVWTA